jgi:hypothetical protein
LDFVSSQRRINDFFLQPTIEKPAMKSKTKAPAKPVSTKPPRVVKHGIIQPRSGKTFKVWEIISKLRETLGRVPTRREVLAKCAISHLEFGTVSTQNCYWRRFHGIKGRVNEPEKAKPAAPKKAAAKPAAKPKVAAKKPAPVKTKPVVSTAVKPKAPAAPKVVAAKPATPAAPKAPAKPKAYAHVDPLSRPAAPAAPKPPAAPVVAIAPKAPAAPVSVPTAA